MFNILPRFCKHLKAFCRHFDQRELLQLQTAARRTSNLQTQHDGGGFPVVKLGSSLCGLTPKVFSLIPSFVSEIRFFFVNSI